MQKSIVKKGTERPQNMRASLLASVHRPELTSRKLQLGLLVLDTSGSMVPNMAALASAATAFVTELAKPANRGVFDVGVVSFGDSAALALAPMPAAQISMPSLAASGLTDMRGALEVAEEAVASHAKREGRQHLRPVVVVMTDGLPTSGDPLPAAARLRALADIITVAFGEGADLALLERMASNPGYALKAGDAATLRGFFEDVGASMSLGMGAGGVSFEEAALSMFASRRR